MWWCRGEVGCGWRACSRDVPSKLIQATSLFALSLFREATSNTPYTTTRRRCRHCITTITVIDSTQYLCINAKIFHLRNTRHWLSVGSIKSKDSDICYNLQSATQKAVEESFRPLWFTIAILRHYCSIIIVSSVAAVVSIVIRWIRLSQGSITFYYFWVIKKSYLYFYPTGSVADNLTNNSYLFHNMIG